MPNTIYKCFSCGRDNFRTKRSLTQHINTSVACVGQRKAADAYEIGAKANAACDVEATPPPMMAKRRKVGSAHQPSTQYSTATGTEEEELEFPVFHASDLDDSFDEEFETKDSGEIDTSIIEN